MRQRKPTNLHLTLERYHAPIVDEPTAYQGEWVSAFMPDARALYLDLGCGKGTFLAEAAARHPDVLFVGIDKEAAFFYLFLGYYPIVKWDIDRLKQKPVRVLLKLLVFNVSIVAMYMILGFLLHMDAVVEDFTQMGVALLIAFIALMNVCMFMYDRLLSPLVILYVKRLRPKLKFLRS